MVSPVSFANCRWYLRLFYLWIRVSLRLPPQICSSAWCHVFLSWSSPFSYPFFLVVLFSCVQSFYFNLCVSMFVCVSPRWHRFPHLFPLPYFMPGILCVRVLLCNSIQLFPDICFPAWKRLLTHFIEMVSISLCFSGRKVLSRFYTIRISYD